MSRYKGRASLKMIESKFPHNVEMIVPEGGFGDRLNAMHDLWASGNQQIWLSTQQFSRADKWAARILDGAIVNDYVLPLAEPILFQLRRKGLVDSRGRSCAVRPEKSYSGDFFNLLRASPKWPRKRRATHKYDEFAPPHLLPRGSDSKIVATFTRAQEGADVRFGSKADIFSAKGHVRFWPKADICA